MKSSDEKAQAVVQHTFRWVYKPTRLHHVDRPRTGPSVDFVPVGTLVRSRVSNWHETVRRPLECNQSEVSMAHRGLTKKVETVFCKA